MTSHPLSSNSFARGALLPGSSDCAQMSAMPSVPCAQVTTGLPSAGAALLGTRIVPVTATGLPSTDSDTYITRYAVPWSPSIATFSDLISVPVFEGSGSGTA